MKSYIDDYKELKQVISENPTLPLIFMANEDCGNPDYRWTVAQAKAVKGIYLEEPDLNEEKIYYDEDDFREDVEEQIYDNNPEFTELQLEEAVNEKMKQYEKSWVDVIYVYIEPY